MAKAKKAKKAATEVRPVSRSGESRAVPAGYKRRSSEAVGFWVSGSNPIHFIPKFARAVDNSQDNKKPSVLILGESHGENEVSTSDGEMITAKLGDLVGVWYKPGMAAIKNMANVPVYMYEEGSKDTGKQSRMKLYEILSPKTGDELFITGDFRQTSLRADLPFESVGRRPQADGDDMPEAHADETP
jgi:hypothetical protein